MEGKWISMAEAMIMQELQKQQEMEMLPNWMLKFCGASYREYDKTTGNTIECVFEGREVTEQEYKDLTK